jgi:uncharacterized protein
MNILKIVEGWNHSTSRATLNHCHDPGTPLTVEKLKVLKCLDAVEAQEWNTLVGEHPFLRHEFLNNLERSGCVSKETGWDPHHITLWRDSSLVAAMPLYLKNHSYGEYIFDWAWADAYHRAGIAYYPKLLSAIPFTPVTGPRLLAQEESLRRKLASAALDLAKELGISSVHILYPTESQSAELVSNSYLQRDSTQFHWRNHGYRDFDDFLGAMSHDKRKKVKQERRKLNDQGIRFECGLEILQPLLQNNLPPTQFVTILESQFFSESWP